ncbi:MAG: hypothetical protein GX488_02780 [Clostridiales bacterium]|nr:hypothetical protein [Clostridiales bacterium]
MNRYNANTGRMERVPEPQTAMPSPPPPGGAGSGNRRRPPAPQGIFGGLGGSGGLGSIFSKFNLSSLELEDLILIAIFYLLYRESGDIEFLLMAGAMLFL